MVTLNSGLAASHFMHRRATQQNPPADSTLASSTPAAPPATTSDTGAADFRTLFCTPASTATPAAAPAQQSAAPTAESVFGPNPWLTSPTGMGPAGAYAFNPTYFATPETAAKVAQMLGGTVVTGNQLVSGGPFSQQQPNQMVQMADGRVVNAGLVAAFYTHGYPQSYIDQLISHEVSNT
jgi:hypothetical protein